jgi:hypothetical protein
MYLMEYSQTSPSAVYLELLITKTSSFISGVPCEALLDGLKQFTYV